jgi:hypothetical protein
MCFLSVHSNKQREQVPSVGKGWSYAGEGAHAARVQLDSRTFWANSNRRGLASSQTVNLVLFSVACRNLRNGI